ncbi:hypothetical protein MPL3365_200149 [Mesorhizobium plurifarium]|uniref:Uncharacterized protein n=1 Tax=Mesorhizobium plurifarium TaxID=69974 RepID=A0A090G322_MESPL|nr:hypothetical protein MPL3365_200149 [Mesorhizobium plurifarium]
MTVELENDTFKVLARRLVEQTGITEADARQLILLLGFDWSSLLREAKALLPPSGPKG